MQTKNSKLLDDICLGAAAELDQKLQECGDQIFTPTETDLEAAPWIGFTGFFTQVTCTCNTNTSGACCD